MQITILGGQGFIGGHLVDYYVNQNYKVNVIDNGETGNYVNKKATYFDLDLVTAQIDDIIKDSDVVIHLASTARVKPSFTNPTKYIVNNVGNVTNCLDTLRRINFKGKFIYFSSSSVYNGCNQVSIMTGSTESTKTRPQSPYAHSKKMAEDMCLFYKSTYNLDIVIVRPFNVYGDRMSTADSYATVLSIFKQQYANKQPLTVTGNGKQQRDFTHVDDIIQGVNLIIEKGIDPIYNIGTGEAVSINALTTVFAWNVQVEYLPPTLEPFITKADTRHIRKLGYKPTHRVLEWLAKNK